MKKITLEKIKNALESKYEKYKYTYIKDEIKILTLDEIEKCINNQKIIVFKNYNDWFEYIRTGFFDDTELLEYFIAAKDLTDGCILKYLDQQTTGSGLETLYIDERLIVVVYVYDTLFQRI